MLVFASNTRRFVFCEQIGIKILFIQTNTMKKLIILAIIVITQISNTQALSPQNVNDIVNAFEKTEQSTNQRIQNLTSFNNLLTIAYQKVQSHIRPIIGLVQNEVQNRLQWQQQEDLEQSYRFPLTTQKWLDLHNSVRETSVQLHPDLMRSAQIWAEHLSENNIRSNTHRRIQWNYNYNDIENWFADLGIRFINNNGITFSENIAYNTVRCNSNCDESLLTATDRSWQFFYHDEKQKNWAHYRAIIQEKFQYIGVGIAINNGRYHIVIHYGTDIKTPIQLGKN